MLINQGVVVIDSGKFGLANTSVERLIILGKQAIQEAGSFPALKGIRDKVEALRVFQRAQGASLDAINAATQLRIRADRAMGEALAEMEKAVGGAPYHRATGDSVSPVGATYANLGVDKKQASRWQAVANISAEVFEASIVAHERQRAPITTASVLRVAEQAREMEQTPADITSMPIPPASERQQREGQFLNALDRASARVLPVQKHTGEYEWYTPPQYIDAARQVMGAIDLDPASNDIAQKAVRATTYYTREDDGLSKEWRGRIWMNPPYAAELIGRFMRKLVAHVQAGDVTAAIVLVDNRTDTSWFHAALSVASRVCFTRGRIAFLRPGGESPGMPTNGSAFLYFGSAPEAFDQVFGELGTVVQKVG